MRILRKFGVLALLLVSCLAPAMACVISNTEMNPEELACCRMMKNRCGQMDNMPASHTSTRLRRNDSQDPNFVGRALSDSQRQV